MSTIRVGPTEGEPERCRITLMVYSDVDLQVEDKQQLIEKARPIIERCLQDRGYPPRAISTFSYGIMYENSERNMKAVGKALTAVQSQLEKLCPPVISTFQLGPFSGEPDDFKIYLSVESNKEIQIAEQLQLTDQARLLIEQQLGQQGYSTAAIASFSYKVVSQEEVEKAGGWYPFLR